MPALQARSVLLVFQDSYITPTSVTENYRLGMKGVSQSFKIYQLFCCHRVCTYEEMLLFTLLTSRKVPLSIACFSGGNAHLNFLFPVLHPTTNSYLSLDRNMKLSETRLIKRQSTRENYQVVSGQTTSMYILFVNQRNIPINKQMS